MLLFSPQEASSVTSRREESRGVEAPSFSAAHFQELLCWDEFTLKNRKKENKGLSSEKVYFLSDGCSELDGLYSISTWWDRVSKQVLLNGWTLVDVGFGYFWNTHCNSCGELPFRSAIALTEPSNIYIFSSLYMYCIWNFFTICKDVPSSFIVCLFLLKKLLLLYVYTW